jgi:hypothetical protein
MSIPKTRACALCGLQFAKSKRFATVCESCVQENDNQTLEAVLGLPGNLLEGDDRHHETTCSHWSGYECDCGEGEVLDPAAMSFHEAVNE